MVPEECRWDGDNRQQKWERDGPPLKPHYVWIRRQAFVRWKKFGYTTNSAHESARRCCIDRSSRSTPTEITPSSHAAHHLPTDKQNNADPSWRCVLESHANATSMHETVPVHFVIRRAPARANISGIVSRRVIVSPFLGFRSSQSSDRGLPPTAPHGRHRFAALAGAVESRP